MALQLVDIFGNLQPATGRTTRGPARINIIPIYQDAVYKVPFFWELDSKKPEANGVGPIESFTWKEALDIYNKDKLLSNGFTQVNDNTFSKIDNNKTQKIYVLGNNYITRAFKVGDTVYVNVFLNIENTDIYKKYVGAKLNCYNQFMGSRVYNMLNFYFREYFNIQTFSTHSVSENPSIWESKLTESEQSIKEFIDAIESDIKRSISNGTIKKETIPACFLPDPDPALSGPPTQAISGVTNKAPVVDNPNIKLPTQEVKGLDANAAQQAASKAQSAASSATSQVQGAAGGLTSQVQGATDQAQGALQGVAGQAQGAVSNVQASAGGILSNLSSGVKGAIGGGALGAGIGALAGGGKGALIGAGAGLVTGGIAGKVFDKLNPKGIKPDGLGKDWSPDKFSPESIAGNDKFVDPKTGLVGSTSKLVSGLKGGLLGGGLGAGIGALVGGGKGALIGGVSGTALGAGLSVGGVTGGALAAGGLGAGIGALAAGGKGAAIGAITGGALGAATAKLASVKIGMPKPNIPKPPNIPRIKVVKIKHPSDIKGVQQLLNLQKSKLGQ